MRWFARKFARPRAGGRQTGLESLPPGMGPKLRPVSMNSRTQQKQRARGLLSSFRAGTFERLFERPARVNAGEVGTVLGGGVKVGIGFDALGGLCGRFFNPLSAWRLPQQRLFHPAGAVGLGPDARQSHT